MTDLDNLPNPFLAARVHHVDAQLGLTGLCVGYELGLWRMRQLADHMLDWLPDFALTWDEREGLHSGNARRMLKRAARLVYTTDKYTRRGEFGELLLHIALRQVFETLPAISKLYYKDSANDTVKGFDCVHVITTPEHLELWLGEAKFYSDIDAAVRAACASLQQHMERDYLRGEFAAITNKLDSEWPHHDRLEALLRPETSLDEIFDVLTVPVLLTYDSDAIPRYDEVTSEYCAAFEAEVNGHHATFSTSNPIEHLKIHLFLVPLEEKRDLLARLHELLFLEQRP